MNASLVAVVTPKTYTKSKVGILGKQLQQAVEASDHMQWKVQLSAAIILNDAHACDIEYHLSCWVTHVQHYPGSKTKEADVDISTACTMQ